MTDAVGMFSDAARQFEARPGSPRIVLDHLAGTGTPIFVDFDYTLFACNSTELFIASCKPSILIAIIDFVVRRCIPWRLTGLKHHFRVSDFICCMLILWVCPWNLFLWRRKAPRLLERYVSQDISAALSNLDLDQIVIVSFGMGCIIRPLLRGSAWENVTIVATPNVPSLRYFAQGKAQLVRKHFSDEQIFSSTFLTDSLDDRDLLSAAHSGILVEPQGDAFRAAEHLYIPFWYTARAKYSFSYVFDQILLVECFLTVAATAVGFGDLFPKLLFIPFFTFSLMAVYEIGYYENDTVAARREAAPSLTRQVARFAEFPMQPAAWLWSIAVVAVGGALAFWTGFLSPEGLLRGSLLWCGSLLALRTIFYVYNRLSERLRIVVYPMLQLMKFLPIFLIFQPTKAGALLTFCQVATIWLIYLIYRKTGQRQIFDKEVLRTGLFGLAVCLMVTTCSLETLGGRFALGLMTAWCVARLLKAPLLNLYRRRRHKTRLHAASPIA